MGYIFWKRITGYAKAARFADTLRRLGVPVLARTVAPHKLASGRWTTHHYFRFDSAYEADVDFAAALAKGA